jgi:hypothetical protein
MNTDVASPPPPLFAWLDRRPLLLVAVLVGVTLGLRGWQLLHTSVTTRDSIGFIRFAWQLEHRPLADTLRGNPQHPLYPFAIWATSQGIRPWMSDDLPRAMERSCLAVNVVVSVLVVVAMFYLGRELFNTAVGFGGALLFQLLPASGRLLGDGLSEPLFYLFSTLCLLAATRGLRLAARGGPALSLLALSGTLAALAYLTRPEGLVLAAIIVFLALLYARSWRSPVVVLAAVLVVAGPYMATIRGLTVKPSAGYLVDPDKWKRDDPGRAVVVQPSALAAWEIDWGKGNDPSRRWGWAAFTLVSIFDRTFFHGLWLFALLGLWLHRDRLRSDAALALHPLLIVLMLGLAYRVAQSNGYLSDRHLTLILLVGVFWILVGMLALATRLGRSEALFVVVFLAIGLLAGYRTTRPLHAERLAFRQAGEWLAANSLPGDRVLDPYAHVYFYSGRVFVNENDPDVPASNPVTAYVVLEHSANKHPHLYHLVQHAETLAKQGEEVARIPLTRKREPGHLAIYKVRWQLPRNVGG